MSVFDIIVKSFSLAASIATLIACVPIFIAFYNYCKNLISGNNICVSTKLLKPVGAHLIYLADFEIELQNKTNRLFYIVNISLLIGNIEVPIVNRVDYTFTAPKPPIKVDPYQISIIKGACSITADCDLNAPTLLKITLPNKEFYYDTLLVDKQYHKANYRKHYQHKSGNNKSNN